MARWYPNPSAPKTNSTFHKNYPLFFSYLTLPSLHITDNYTLPRLPHIHTHSNQAIKQLLSQRNSRQLLLLPLSIDDQKPISDLPRRGPADDEFGFPT